MHWNRWWYMLSMHHEKRHPHLRNPPSSLHLNLNLHNPPSSHRTPDQFLQSSNHQNHPTTMQHKPRQVYATHLKIFCQSWDPHIHPLIHTLFIATNLTRSQDLMELRMTWWNRWEHIGTDVDVWRNRTWRVGWEPCIPRNGWWHAKELIMTCWIWCLHVKERIITCWYRILCVKERTLTC